MAKQQKRTNSDPRAASTAKRGQPKATAKPLAPWWALSKEAEHELQERKWHRYLSLTGRK